MSLPVSLTETSMNNIDRISSLPAELIHKILSDLSIRDIAQTSSLSKQWKTFSDAFLYLNFDQQLLSLPYDQFKQLVDRRLELLEQKDIVLFRSRLCLRPNNIYPSHIQSWVISIAQKNIKEFDFRIIKHSDQFRFLFKFPREIFNAETVTVLKLSGCEIPFFDNIMLSQLNKLRFENVLLENESVLIQFFISCPLIMELGLVECHGLKNLQVSGLAQLQQLEIVLCPELEVVQIQARGLQTLLLSEARRKPGQNPLKLIICSKTVETLRELKLLNSGLSGKDFISLFAGCSNLESLALSDTFKFCEISISSQKLRRLVMKSCLDIIFSDPAAPILRSDMFEMFVRCSRPLYIVGTGQLLCYTIDRTNMFPLGSQGWFAWFKNSLRKSQGGDCQKIVIFLNELRVMYRRYDVLLLEGWSSMEEFGILTKLICGGVRRMIITNMSFPDLAEYMFSDSVSMKFLAISSGECKLYEALMKKKPKYSCQFCSSDILSSDQKGVTAALRGNLLYVKKAVI